MQSKLNAHQLFRGNGSTSGYLQNLAVSDGKQKQLRGARDQIRQALREGMPPLQKAAVANGLIDQRHMVAAGALPPLRPRFRMKGSAAYPTPNGPPHNPPQQLHYDDR